MKIWVDAQISPAIAQWLAATYSEDAIALKDIGLRDAEDVNIFDAARKAGAVLMTKDVDFADLVRRLGPPPQILWITCGNTSNARLQVILANAWPRVVELLRAGERLVEVSDGTT